MIVRHACHGVFTRYRLARFLEVSIEQNKGALQGIFSYINEATGSLPNLAAYFNAGTFAADRFFDSEPQKRSRVTKLGAQTQHSRVIQRFLPPYTSKKSEISCAWDKCVVFNNIDQAISGSTEIESIVVILMKEIYKS